MTLPSAAFVCESGSTGPSSTPWHLREVPRPVAAVVVSPLVLLAGVATLLLTAVVVTALAVLLVAPGFGLVYLLFPESAFAVRPFHVAIAAVLGAAAWAVLLLTMARVVHHAVILELNMESYRAEAARQRHRAPKDPDREPAVEMMEIAPLHSVALRDSHIPTAPLLLPLWRKETERSAADSRRGGPANL